MKEQRGKILFLGRKVKSEERKSEALSLEERIEAEGKTFEELMKPLRYRQREFLVLRLMGIERNIVLRRIERKYATYNAWARGEEFRKAERLFLGLRERYIEDALGWFILHKARPEAIAILGMLLRKGLDSWDILDKGDKQSILKAVELVMKFDTIIEGGKAVSYEEMIIKLRKQMGAVDISNRMLEEGQ